MHLALYFRRETREVVLQNTLNVCTEQTLFLRVRQALQLFEKVIHVLDMRISSQIILQSFLKRLMTQVVEVVAFRETYY